MCKNLGPLCLLADSIFQTGLSSAKDNKLSNTMQKTTSRSPDVSLDFSSSEQLPADILGGVHQQQL
jgi:hypothetical protein